MHIFLPKRSTQLYKIYPHLIQPDGQIVVDDFQIARIIAYQINRYFIAQKHISVRGWEIQALAQITDIYPQVFAYISDGSFDFYKAFKGWWQDRVKKSIDTKLHDFFCCTSLGEEEAYWKRIITAWLFWHNPAFAFYRAALDPDKHNKNLLRKFEKINLHEFFVQLPGPDFATEKDLDTFLHRPLALGKTVIVQQMEYMRHYWWISLNKKTRKDLPRTLKFIYEEQQEDQKRASAPDRILEFSTERIKPSLCDEAAWMRNLVLIAKNTFVWLEQLSQKYQTSIERLDEIPEEELAFLKDAGINGLWLIGIWKRSPASQKIKELYGNQDAIASAYSVYEYRITEELGGEAAYALLKEQAAKHHIRLASDMVPNHTGLDSPWVVNHPDWFIHSQVKPKEYFEFNSPELSLEKNVSIKLEQQYYDRTGAAEVFQYLEKKTKAVKYIYHGNDGTSMPWNDTAQLNYLLEEVREAVIQTIIEIARKFPIIRFDAAMALTKMHYQRLWYPRPGKTDCVPTREKFSMRKEDFESAMPKEFWLEVVQRIESEVPDTLLLAEAFWLTESFFIRELGMHRVYNSAFMNLLRDEQNKEYRQILKNVLASDAAILGRFVNFLNNPDERTAADQFGTGDKYFGICTLMATMPGLPLFGHGQLEGFSERYGMDFKKPLWDEQVDEPFMERHRREIFPLLQRRAAFSDPKRFMMLDFVDKDGQTDENVIAFINESQQQKYLVIFNNHYRETSGTLKETCPMRAENDEIQCIPFASTLGTPVETQKILFSDPIHETKVEFSVDTIIKVGFKLQLNAYQTLTFLEIQFI